MMNSEKSNYDAGVAKGQAEEKTSNMVDKASNAAHSAQDSMQEGGQQMKAKAQGAADAVKETVNK